MRSRFLRSNSAAPVSGFLREPVYDRMNSPHRVAGRQKSLTEGIGVLMRISVLAAAVSLALIGLSHGADARAAIKKPTDIPAQTLGPALQQLSKERDLQLVFRTDVVGELQTSGAAGDLTFDEAMTLLLKGTGLSFLYLDDKTVTILPARTLSSPSTTSSEPPPVSAPAADRSFSERLLMAQVNEPAVIKDHAVPAEKIDPVDEIVVTGSHIRGADSSASPVLTFDRTDIERTGFMTVQQFMESLPQNFSEVGSGTSVQAPTSDASRNIGMGSGVNLRGLDSSSTLVLLNGRRLAPSGTNGSFVDVSSIPLAAVERVEVLTDGASAIYGADAVAGVVNFVLRKEYDGAQTQVRYADVTQGSREEFQFSQILGRHWDGGHLLLTYDFGRQMPLASADRTYAANADLRPLGGSDWRDTRSNPGTIVAGGTTFAIPFDQDGTGLTPADFVAGTANRGNQNEGTNLFPGQKHHAALLTLDQDISDRFGVFLEGYYSHRQADLHQAAPSLDLVVRDTNPYFVDPTGTGLPQVTVRYSLTDDLGYTDRSTFTDVYGATAGMRWNAGGDWHAEAYAAYSTTRLDADYLNSAHTGLLNEALGNPTPISTETAFDPLVDGYFNPFGDGSHSNPAVLEFIAQGFSNYRTETATSSVTAIANGTLLRLPGGAAKLAVGAEYREETLDSKTSSSGSLLTPAPPTVADLSRDMNAAFVEAIFPLVGSENRIRGVERIDLTLAGRYERYSDFGSAFSPKLGLMWEPLAGLRLRGTYGTSFKPPLLTELDVSNPGSNLAVFFTAPTVPLATLVLIGNNPELEPEEADTWTAGFQLAPPALRGLQIDASYFDIDFKKRVVMAVTNVRTPFTDLERYAPILTPNPPEDLVRHYVETLCSSCAPITGVDPATGNVLLGGQPVQMLLDVRLKNLASTRVSGIDVNFRYPVSTHLGQLDFTLNANYLTRFDEAFLSTQAPFNVLNTIARPVDLRMRGSGTWSRNGFSMSAFLNYSNSYTDTISVPNRHIGSWTTADLQLRYDASTAGRTNLLEGVVLALSALNLLDEDPPFVDSTRGVGYDATNASPLGRYIALSLSRRW